MDTAIVERPMPTGEGLTFEKVWAMFQETDKKFREDAAERQKEAAERQKEAAERQKEFDRQMKESAERQKEFDRIMKEAAERHEKDQRELKEQMKERADRFDKELEKTKRLIDRNGRQMGGLHNKFGKLAEHLVAPGIAKRFNELGYHFDIITSRGCKVIENGKVKAEIDILLENGETIIAVEVKANPAIKHIEHHIKQLEILREYRQKLNFPPKKILGAIAGAIYEDEVKEAVREAGFFVIEQSGDTMKIDMPDDFVPKEW